MSPMKTVQELIQDCAFTVFHLAEPKREVSGGYAGDLLSWVLGRAELDNIWLTIMSNKNVAAVAMMTECACVVLTEGVQPDPDLLAQAQRQGINLLGSDKSTFALAGALSALLV